MYSFIIIGRLLEKYWKKKKIPREIMKLDKQILYKNC